MGQETASSDLLVAWWRSLNDISIILDHASHYESPRNSFQPKNFSLRSLFLQQFQKIYLAKFVWRPVPS